MYRKTKVLALLMILGTNSLSYAKNPPTNPDPELMALNDNSEEMVKNSPWYKKSLASKDARLKWWEEARFGAMMHWGAYSPLGGEYKGKQVTNVPGYAEQIMRQGKIKVAEYKEDVVTKFNPVDFDAKKWCSLLSEAGMKYLVITAKHHDGFAVWPSEVNDYDLDGMTDFKRDPMMELKNECGKLNIKFGFYYSQAQEWSHKYGTYNHWDFNHPRNQGSNWFLETRNKEHALNVRHYFDEVAIPHVLELSRKYDPDMFWFDVAFTAPQWENNRLLAMLRAVNPDVIVNSRIGGDFGDYLSTNDKAIEYRLLEERWEGVPTITESYGYHKFDKTHKKPEELVEVIIKAAAKSGNTMLNIGPMGDGTIDIADANVLKGIGSWIKHNGESIYGTKYSGLPPQSWGQITAKNNHLYLHILQKPVDGIIKLSGLGNSIKKLSHLKSGADVAFQLKDGVYVINVNDNILKENIPVLKVDYDRKIEVSGGQHVVTTMDNRLHVFEAEYAGKNFRYGSGQKKSEYIFAWRNKDTYPKWLINVEKAGNYDIDIYFDTKSLTSARFGNVKAGAELVLRNGSEMLASFNNSDKDKVSLKDMPLKAGESVLSLRINSLLGKEAGRLKYMIIKKKTRI